MSRRRSLTSDQDHLLHILVLAGFLVLLVIGRSQTLVDRPLAVIGMALVYLILNAYVDIRAKMFSADRVLEYGTIALFGSIIMLSV